MPTECISIMGLLTVLQLQATGGNILQKPVTVKIFFVSTERWREGSEKDVLGGGRPGSLYEPD